MISMEISDYIAIAFCYFLFIGPIHVFLGCMGTLIGFAMLLKQSPMAFFVIKTSWLFTGFLFLGGFFLNIFWTIFVFNKLYWNYDYAGWECSPFYLVICSGDDKPATFFHGITVGFIYFLWVAYVILSWGVAAGATYAIAKHWKHT